MDEQPAPPPNVIVPRDVPATTNETAAHPKPFGAIPLTLTASPSPLHDGRIRNPVPNKLKGKTDGTRGEFSVMQVEMPKPMMTVRDLAAKRSSEATVAAAMAAQAKGYIPLRWRSQLVAANTTPQPQSSSSPAFAQAQSNQYPNPVVLPAPPRPALPDRNSSEFVAPLPPPPPPPPSHPAQPPRQPAPPPSFVIHGTSPWETKSQQARLLTLLRSLHPVLVADQLCKALAYFGGIPGAPPPSDGLFPQSASHNGPGTLFVAWISEIFPALDQDGQPLKEATGQRYEPTWQPDRGRVVPYPLPYAQGPTSFSLKPSSRKRQPTGRPVGRPRGSKTRRGSKRAADGSLDPEADGTTETGEPGETGTQEGSGTTQSITPYTGKRKRGRPKGSKNRPKPVPDSSSGADGTVASMAAARATQPVADSPSANKSSSAIRNPPGIQDMGDTAAGSDGSTKQRQSSAKTATQGNPAASYNIDNNAVQETQPTQAGNPTNVSPVGRKRRSSQLMTQEEDRRTLGTSRVLETVDGGSSLQPPRSVGRGDSAQVQQMKRHRFSRESRQEARHIGSDSTAIGAGIAAEPKPTASLRTGSAPSDFNSQGQFSDHGNFARPGVQQERQHQHDSQSQRQHLPSQQINQAHQQPLTNQQQLSQGSRMIDFGKGQNHGQIQQQPPEQQSPNMPSQSPEQAMMTYNLQGPVYYGQRMEQVQQLQHQQQITSQFGQSGGVRSNMVPESPLDFQRNAPDARIHGTNPRLSLSRQRNQQQDQKRSGQQQAQRPAQQLADTSPNMSSFSNYTAEDYLGMDYGPAAFDPSQLNDSL